MKRPAEDLAAELLAALHDPIQMRHGRVADLAVGRDRIGFRPHHRDGRRAEPQALEPLAQPGIRGQVAGVEDRDLRRVEPQDLDLVDITSWASVTWSVQSSRFMPVFIGLLTVGLEVSDA